MREFQAEYQAISTKDTVLNMTLAASVGDLFCHVSAERYKKKAGYPCTIHNWCQSRNKGAKVIECLLANVIKYLKQFCELKFPFS
jgi:hypothetical protein